MLDPRTETIVIDRETISPDMVKRVEWYRTAVQVMGPNDFLSYGQVIPGDGIQRFAPGHETHVTLHMKDGRTLRTTIYT